MFFPQLAVRGPSHITRCGCAGSAALSGRHLRGRFSHFPGGSNSSQTDPGWGWPAMPVITGRCEPGSRLHQETCQLLPRPAAETIDNDLEAGLT